MISRDFHQENYLPNPVKLGNIKVFPKSLKDSTRKILGRIYRRKFDTNQSETPFQTDYLREELPDLLLQLNSFGPLRCTENQQKLAQKALSALKNRQQDDMRNLAKNLANDVADAVD
ncbi:MAG: hypothetical protein AB1589_23660 [Cyanobacteriota bacterium]